METTVNKDHQFATRSTLNDFTVDALTLSASLFQNRIERTLNTCAGGGYTISAGGSWRCGRVGGMNLAFVGNSKILHTFQKTLQNIPKKTLQNIPKIPYAILNMGKWSPWIRRWFRENGRSCWTAASYEIYRRPFTNYIMRFSTFWNASAPRDRSEEVAWVVYSRCGRIKNLSETRKRPGLRATKNSLR